MEHSHNVEFHKLALAIDPTSGGFCYALFEGPQTFLDWGVTDIRSEKNPTSLERIKKLINFYKPEILVLEDCSWKIRLRCRRVRDLLGQVEKFAKSKKIPVVKYSPDRVQEVFSFFEVKTKYQIAERISERYPPLAPYLAPRRKPWMSEDTRMSIFDAAALIITYYYLEE